MKERLNNRRYCFAALLLAISFLGAPVTPVAYAQTTPAATPASATLSESTIKALQEALNKQGIAVKADGVMNDETRAAIRKYQSQHHLPVTGEADKATLDKLGVSSQSSTAPSPASTVGQATPPSTGQPPSPQMPVQSGQGSGGMMSGPMMQDVMQGMMTTMQGMMGMMQGQMPPGQMQFGQTQSGWMQRGPMWGPQSGMMMSCPTMWESDQARVPAMMQMMQGMMQMMQMMQNQMQSGQRS
jgi:hypothetical protein